MIIKEQKYFKKVLFIININREKVNLFILISLNLSIHYHYIKKYSIKIILKIVNFK